VTQDIIFKSTPYVPTSVTCFDHHQWARVHRESERVTLQIQDTLPIPLISSLGVPVIKTLIFSNCHKPVIIPQAQRSHQDASKLENWNAISFISRAPVTTQWNWLTTEAHNIGLVMFAVSVHRNDSTLRRSNSTNRQGQRKTNTSDILPIEDAWNSLPGSLHKLSFLVNAADTRTRNLYNLRNLHVRHSSLQQDFSCASS